LEFCTFAIHNRSSTKKSNDSIRLPTFFTYPLSLCVSASSPFNTAQPRKRAIIRFDPPPFDLSLWRFVHQHLLFLQPPSKQCFVTLYQPTTIFPRHRHFPSLLYLTFDTALGWASAALERASVHVTSYVTQYMFRMGCMEPFVLNLDQEFESRCGSPVPPLIFASILFNLVHFFSTSLIRLGFFCFSGLYF
jgi:hypothetical protein